MSDHLDLKAIKEEVDAVQAIGSKSWVPAEIARALISEVERKNEVISRAMRLCEQERASMTLNVLREALSESPTETKGENG